MKKLIVSVVAIAVATMASVSTTNAQCVGCSATPNAPADTSKWPCQGSRQFSQGNTSVTCPKISISDNPLYGGYLALKDDFSPHPFYAYNSGGRQAARMHEWNKYMGQQRPWHGGYNYWRWNAPTALVTPPTAAFQSSYAWGVGQTRSVPINHQFGTMNPGGGAGSGSFSQTPYLPSSTEQMGVYPVRAPWSHQ